VPHSTVGYERLFNWAFEYTDEDAFVTAVLAGQPEPPRYFAEMKRINREGPRALHGFRRPEHLPVERLQPALGAGAPVVDTRAAADYAAAHVPGTINIPLNSSFTTWAGWLLPYDRDFFLIVHDRSGQVDEAVRDLAMIGLDRVSGVFDAGVVEAWSALGRDVGRVPQITAADLRRRMSLGEVAVLDVRGRAEWEAGHIPGVNSIPVGYLADHLPEIPTERPLVVQCQSGARSAIGASVLRAHGLHEIINLTGGLAAWQQAGLPVETTEAAGVLVRTP
jgi:hydroxyacylglutathione hydrolase